MKYDILNFNYDYDYDYDQYKISYKYIPGIKNHEFDYTNDIITTISNARVGRKLMVQQQTQLDFICKMFGLDSPELSSDEFINIGSHLWKDKNPVTFDNSTIIDNKTNFSKNCKTINRYGDILPWNDTNVILEYTGEECSQYINANYIECNKDLINADFNGKVIAGQCPKPDPLSRNSFMRMLRQEDIGRIIMVTNMVEQGKPKCNDYTEGEGIGKHGSETLYGSADIYKLRDNNLIHYIKPIYNESLYDFTSPNPNEINSFLNDLNIQQHYGNE